MPSHGRIGRNHLLYQREEELGQDVHKTHAAWPYLFANQLTNYGYNRTRITTADTHHIPLRHFSEHFCSARFVLGTAAQDASACLSATDDCAFRYSDGTGREGRNSMAQRGHKMKLTSILSMPRRQRRRRPPRAGGGHGRATAWGEGALFFSRERGGDECRSWVEYSRIGVYEWISPRWSLAQVSGVAGKEAHVRPKQIWIC